MTEIKQYVVPVFRESEETLFKIQNCSELYDQYGNPRGFTLSRMGDKYLGQFYILWSDEKEPIERVYEILTGLEGLVVLPIRDTSIEEDIDLRTFS